MNTRSQTLRNTVFSSVGMYTEYVLGMLTSIFIARHLGPDGFGAYGAVIWLVAMGVATTNSGTATAAIKFIAELRGAGREELIPELLDYLRRAQRWFLLFVLLAGAAIILLAGNRIAPTFNHVMLLGFLALGISLRASYMFNIGVAKGFENFRANAIVALICTPLNLAMVVLTWWFDLPVEWLLGIFLVSGLMFFLVSRAQIAPLLPARKPGVVLDTVLTGRIRHHMLMSTLTVTVGFLAASEVEVMFLNMYSDPHAAGQFRVAYQMATGAAALVPGVFGALLLPMMANALSQGREVAGRRFIASTSYLGLLAAPLVAFGTVFSSPLIRLLYGTDYMPAAPVFAVCLAGAALTTMSQGGSSLLISADRQRSVLILVLACGALKICLDALLIHHFGLSGAMVAFAAVAMVSTAAMLRLAIKVSQVSPDWGKLLRIAAAASISGLVAWPLSGHLSPAWSLLTGGMVLVVVYAPLTLLLGCWSRGDIEHLQHLHQRFGAGKPRVGARLLSWAYERAPGTSLT